MENIIKCKTVTLLRAFKDGDSATYNEVYKDIHKTIGKRFEHRCCSGSNHYFKYRDFMDNIKSDDLKALFNILDLGFSSCKPIWKDLPLERVLEILKKYDEDDILVKSA